MLKELERFVDTMLGAGGMQRDHPGYELVTQCGTVFNRVVRKTLQRALTEDEHREWERQMVRYTAVARGWNESSVTGEVAMQWRFPGPSMQMPEPALWVDEVLKSCLNNQRGWIFETLDDNTTRIALCWNKDRAYAVVQEIDASLAVVDESESEGQVFSVKLLMVSKFGSVLPTLVQQGMSEDKVAAGHLWWDLACRKFVAMAGMMTSSAWNSMGEGRGGYECSDLLQMFNAKAGHNRKPWGNLIRMFAPRASRVDGVNINWLPAEVRATFAGQDRFFWSVNNTHLIYVINMSGNTLFYKIGFVAKSRAELDGVCGWG